MVTHLPPPNRMSFGDDLAYDAGPMRARLALHPLDDAGFVAALTALADGSLHPDHGGSWERCAKVAPWLAERERQSKAADRVALEVAYAALGGDKLIVGGIASTAGIERHVGSVLLTDGEVAFYRYVIEHVTEFHLDDIFAAVVATFGEDMVPGLQTGTEGEGTTTLSPSEDSEAVAEVRAKILDPDVLFPDGYTDGVPTGTATEIKEAVWGYCHRLLVAELERPKPRKSVLEFLMAKCKGFKIPEEWRVQ